MAANTSARASMVGWIAATSIISVVAVVFAIYSYVEGNRADTRLESLTKEYTDVVGRDMLKGEEVAKLDAARKDTNAGSYGLNSSMKLLSVALTQRGNLAKVIGGTDDDTAAFVNAQNAIDKAKATGVKPAGDSLTATIDALVTDNNSKKAAAANSETSAKDSQTKLKQVVEAQQKQVESLSIAMQKLNAEKDAALQSVQDLSKKQAGDFEGTAAGLNSTLQERQKSIEQLTNQVTEMTDKLKKSATIIQGLQDKLGETRVDPAKSVVRQADGHIISLPRTGICYIDLGYNDHISPGLTFEVYDKVEGIPAPGDPTSNEKLPIGKASIEVISTTPGSSSSQCRVTRLASGATLSEGDLVANVVYDKNTKYAFVVHGKFDLDQNGLATAEDTEVIKKLITRWGGDVTDAINENTDFVVLGKEPAIPEKPADPNDPVAQKNYEDATAAYEKYGEISAAARAYHIPILNQNRFLYLCGYYEQAKR